MTIHKIKRKIIRKKWIIIKLSIKKLKQNYVKPNSYDKIRKYEKRKSKLKPKREDIFSIELGSKIDFEKNIKNLFKITNQFSKHINSHIRKNFIINHNELKEVSIDGLLYLVSQITKLNKVKKVDNEKRFLKYNKKFGLKNADEKLKHLFHEIGYWNYFGIKKPYNVSKSIEDTYFLSLKSSIVSDIDSLNDIKKFINTKVSIFNDYNLEYKLDDAIKEAMGNSLEHAYPDDFSEIGKDRSRWWICGHFDKKTKVLQIVFYDYGIGIRESLSRNMGEEAKKYLWDSFSDNFIKDDSDLIEQAIDGKLSKYKSYTERDRGKGFKRFQDLAQSLSLDCELKVISSKGKYTFTYDNISKNKTQKKENLNQIIDGMLIKWTIKLGEVYE